MREYLFRGKRTDNKGWVVGHMAILAGFTFIIPENQMFRHPGDPDIEDSFVEVIPETVGQYIWLKDKNNTKAFVGDIFIDAKGIKRTIMQNSGGFVTESNPTAFGYNTFPYEALSDEQNASWFSGTCEIINNIHDNPELINK